MVHEFSMSSEIFRRVMEEAKRKKADKILEIKIVIGELTFLNHDQIKFWIKELSRGTTAENAKVVIVSRKSKIKCKKCCFEGELKMEENPVYHIMTPTFKCPKCGSPEIDIITGREVMVKGIRIFRKS
ncbi:MAG: hydrogenase maturation nickel metallochaperone HypA [Candidatus Aenigmarchaeota archaeon]|nr:hydrogenase maturation nickel metallochaperone HypA [Candidatus Aenigmarchaeota archaeon]